MPRAISVNKSGALYLLPRLAGEVARRASGVTEGALCVGRAPSPGFAGTSPAGGGGEESLTAP
jgi:hypothetical protein